MTDLREIMGYFAKHYPHRQELSKARLTKMIYLADWKSALESGHQMSDISWRFNHYGPYVDDVHQLALIDPAFDVKADYTMFGNRKERIELVDPNFTPSVTADEARILDHVIEETRSLTWEAFIKLVYSTFPVVTGTRGGKLDLIKSAGAYLEF